MLSASYPLSDTGPAAGGLRLQRQHPGAVYRRPTARRSSPRWRPTAPSTSAPTGRSSYRSGANSTPLEIAAQEEVPTAAEAVLGASILLEQLDRGPLRRGGAVSGVRPARAGRPPSLTVRLSDQRYPHPLFRRRQRRGDRPLRDRDHPPVPAVPAVQHLRGDVSAAAAAADAGHRRGASRHGAVRGLCRRRRQTRCPPAGWRTESADTPLRRWKGGPSGWRASV